MRLLPKNEINSKANDERKNAINSGVFLAKKIDALREEILTLQKERDEFISGSQQVINDSLSLLHQKQYDLDREVSELGAKRKALLKPLDDEWAEVKKTKAQIAVEKERNRIDREQINEDEKITQKTKEETERIRAKTHWQATETEKARSEAFNLKELAEQEYEIMQSNRQVSDKENERKLSELYGKIKTYENGIALYETKEKDLTERENQLLKDKQHLESQQRQLKIAYEIIKKNGTNGTTDDSS